MITNPSWSLGSCSNNSFEPALRLETSVRPLHPGDHPSLTPHPNCVHCQTTTAPRREISRRNSFISRVCTTLAVNKKFFCPNFCAFFQTTSKPLKPAKNHLNHIKPDKNQLAFSAIPSRSGTNHINHLFDEKTRGRTTSHEGLVFPKRRFATPFGPGQDYVIVHRIALTIVFSVLLLGCGRKETPQIMPTALAQAADTNSASEINSTNTIADKRPLPAVPIAELEPITTVTQTVQPVVTPAPAKPKPLYPAQEIYEKGVAELKRSSESSDRQAAERALAFFREAAEAGNPPAQNALGVSYLAGIGVQKNVEQGLVWLNKSAAHNYADAQFKLASLYIRGDVVPADTAKALDFARKAAEQGHTEAQYNLGTIYAMGKGVPKDPKAAAEWFRKAAEAGHPTAQSNLGVLYASGDALEKDMALAVQWWRKAAEQGQPSAQFNLAQALLEGKAVPKDLVEAYKWYHLAADRGDRDAARMRNALGIELSPEEVADALKRAREFKSRLQAELREKRTEAF